MENTYLPTVKRVYPSLHVNEEIINNIKSRIISENREGKINSIVSDIKFDEIKLEEDEEYKKAIEIKVVPLPPPSNTIYYCEFRLKKNR